jgi:hypothetical protein
MPNSSNRRRVREKATIGRLADKMFVTPLAGLS